MHSTGKFEKVYDDRDIKETFSGLEMLKKERVSKKTTFGEKEYSCNHFWLVFRKQK